MAIAQLSFRRPRCFYETPTEPCPSTVQAMPANDAPSPSEHDETEDVVWRGFVARGERLNTITHGFGALLSVAALILMVASASTRGDAYKIVSVSVYGTSLILLYLASFLYHLAQDERVKAMMKLVDHSCIYILIAGTYTPFTLVSIRGAWGWSLFGVIWGLAVLGVIFKLYFIHRFDKSSVAVYIAMGWLAVIAAGPMLSALPTGGIACIVAGGLAYTAGAGVYLWRSLPHNHAIWHLFVMTGSAFHFWAVYAYVLPAK